MIQTVVSNRYFHLVIFVILALGFSQTMAEFCNLLFSILSVISQKQLLCNELGRYIVYYSISPVLYSDYSSFVGNY